MGGQGVEVVGHQAIAPNREALLSRLLAQEIAIKFVIIVAEEHFFPPIAALRDVMRQSRNDKAGHARYGQSPSGKDCDWHGIGVK